MRRFSVPQRCFPAGPVENPCACLRDRRSPIIARPWRRRAAYNVRALAKQAKNTIAAQSESVGNMQDNLDRCGSLGNTEADLCPYHRSLDRIVQMMFSQMQNPGADNQSTLILYGKRSPATKGDPHVEKCAPLFQLSQTRSDIAVDYCPAGKRRARREAAHAPPI